MIDKKLEEMIYEVRGQYVMLDSDLALLYGYQDGTKSINRAIKRHLELFNDEMYYQLTKEESDIIWCQIGTKKTTIETRGGKYNTPHVLTQEGIKILSGILRKSNVLEVTNDIIKAFENLKQEIIPRPSIPVSKEKIVNMIYESRGNYVMLDSDLAELYGVETKRINEAVSRNKDKFLDRFTWKLSEDEMLNLKSQFATSSWNNYGGSRKYPRVFTEQGAFMLSTVLKSPTATRVAIFIIDAFVAMRKYISTSLINQCTINNQVLLNSQNILENKRELDEIIKSVNDNKEHIHINTDDIIKNTKDIIKNTDAIERLNQVVYKFDEIRNQNAIFFQGQIYDAYSKLVDIMSEAKEELIIVDGYADKKVLDIISKLSVSVILLIKSEGNLSDLVINTYKEQYGNLTVIRTNTIHDRFIILDRKVVYHCGTSINHAGRGAFAINVIEDEHMKKSCLEWIFDIIEEP